MRSDWERVEITEVTKENLRFYLTWSMSVRLTVFQTRICNQHWHHATFILKVPRSHANISLLHTANRESRHSRRYVSGRYLCRCAVEAEVELGQTQHGSQLLRHVCLFAGRRIRADNR